MKTKIGLLLVPLFAFFIFSFTSVAYAQCGSNVTTKQAIQCGAGEASGNKENPNNATATANNTIENIINLFSAVVGVIALFMLIYGGFRYVTSSGNDQSTKSARDTILYAIIGLIIVALAQIIVKFVIRSTDSNQTGSSSSSLTTTGSGSTGTAGKVPT